MTRASVPQSAIERALRALKAVGERIASVNPQPDGSVSILTPEGKEVALSPLEAWEKARGQRAA
jgi:hypothetical protein